MSRLTRLTTLLAFGLQAGCGAPSVSDTCDTLDDARSCFEEWDYEDCLDDGSRLQDMAQAKECDDAFDDYISCVNVSVCGFEAECTVERDNLTGCVGDFP